MEETPSLYELSTQVATANAWIQEYNAWLTTKKCLYGCDDDVLTIQPLTPLNPQIDEVACARLLIDQAIASTTEHPDSRPMFQIDHLIVRAKARAQSAAAIARTAKIVQTLNCNINRQAPRGHVGSFTCKEGDGATTVLHTTQYIEKYYEKIMELPPQQKQGSMAQLAAAAASLKIIEATTIIDGAKSFQDHQDVISRLAQSDVEAIKETREFSTKAAAGIIPIAQYAANTARDV